VSQRVALGVLFGALTLAFAAVAAWAVVGAGGSARRWVVAFAAGALAAWLATIAWPLLRRN
jgi:hypothetical protein